jgi:hypothetical protein
MYIIKENLYMNSKIKRIVSVLIGLCFVLSLSASAVSAMPSKMVKINGEWIEQDCNACHAKKIYCLECEEQGDHQGHWKHTLWIDLDKNWNHNKKPHFTPYDHRKGHDRDNRDRDHFKPGNHNNHDNHDNHNNHNPNPRPQHPPTPRPNHPPMPQIRK